MSKREEISNICRVALTRLENEKVNEYIDNQNKEIERLNNIINELEKYLIEQVEKSYSNDYDNVLDKLQELKGDDKE